MKSLSNITPENIFISILCLLVVKSIVIHPLMFAESLLGVAILGFVAYNRHLAHKKAVEIQESYEKRLANMESKISMLSLGKINQR